MCVYFFRGWQTVNDSTSSSSFPNRKKKWNTILYRKKHEHCRLPNATRTTPWIDYILFCRRAFCLRFVRFTEEECRLVGTWKKTECTGVDKMCGVRLNTCQYCPPPHTLSSNKFFFISFVIYLWLIMHLGGNSDPTEIPCRQLALNVCLPAGEEIVIVSAYRDEDEAMMMQKNTQ